jgi:hypothetical protein
LIARIDVNGQDQDDDKPGALSPDANPDPVTPDSPPVRKRDPRSRIRLLEKLPKLAFASWSAKEDFKADEEWAGIVSLRSDAVLAPLENLVPGRRGE